MEKGEFFGALPQTPQGGVAPLTRILSGHVGYGWGRAVYWRLFVLANRLRLFADSHLRGLRPLKLPRN